MRLFSEGSTPPLTEVLVNRERRAAFQQQLGQKFPEAVLVAFKCNIPGPVKNNRTIKQLFEVGTKRLEQIFFDNKREIYYIKKLDLPTGPEAFYAVTGTPEALKAEMIQVEETGKLGRLFDIDVFYWQYDHLESVSRRQLGYSSRQCLLCSMDAKDCGRNRTHPLDEILAAMEEMIHAEIAID